MFNKAYYGFALMSTGIVSLSWVAHSRTTSEAVIGWILGVILLIVACCLLGDHFKKEQ